MINLKFMDCVDITRSLFYLWVAVESSLLAYIYNYGYENMKKTPVIGAIRNVFISLAIAFFYFSFIPIVKILSLEAYFVLLGFSLIVIIFIILSLRNFRHLSLKVTDKMKKIK